ncbi:methyl-accepting chemotaxis protein [Massilia sp. DWR3-1-1]|uniref:methyl-accepting chemotaxis protein n=1 Tax=Massilia sp. DWR3-1-1 TaxID=2804559 RepID=UPI003CE77CAB
MNKLNIGTRLQLAFGAMLLILIGIAGFGWSSLAATKARMDVVVNENNLKIALSNRALLDLNLITRSTRNYILYKDPAVLLTMRGRIDTARKNIEANLARLATQVSSEKAIALFAVIKTETPATIALLDKVRAMVDAGEAEQAPAFLLGTVQVPQDAALASLGAMTALQEEQNEIAVQSMHEQYQFSVRALVAATVFAAIISAAMAWLIGRSITVPVNHAVRIAQTVAAGDLSSNIVVVGSDEISDLLQALQAMNTSLAGIVGEVRAGSDTIATGSRQIAVGSADLSVRTEQQASSLEETASSMEELTATVRQNSDNARQANTLAQSASSVAVRGGKVVAQVVETMGSINDSARKIVDIIGVIDGIAFQTNILALNAAVEAARAGEQGRGFAVVASEVRNLAQRSAAAAKEIKGLIGDSVEKVDAGARLVDEAGVTMDEIVASVARVTDIMGEINTASLEQSAGIDQINQAITQMDDVTQQNAALVEQASAAAESLTEQAAKLSRVVAVFTLGTAVAQAGDQSARRRIA